MQEPLKILSYEENGNPIDYRCIKRFVHAFPKSYHEVVGEIIENSRNLNRGIFEKNIARLMPPFKMTRRGAFCGVRVNENDQPCDPKGVIESCWNEVEDKLLKLKEDIAKNSGRLRNRVLVELSATSRNDVIKETAKLFERLQRVSVEIETGKRSKVGPVGASKVLFAVLPEIALPVDNAEWKHVFKTKDYGQILTKMTNEIVEWEDKTETKLEDINPKLTWPAVYNVMAMAVRP